MKCHSCGTDLAGDAAFCHQCGAKTAAGPQKMLDRAGDSPGEDEEQSLWEGGYSGKAMIGSWVLALIVTIAGAVTAALIPGVNLLPLTWIIVGSVAAAIWLWLLLVLAYRKMSVHYELTTQRFIHKTGFLSRVTDRIEVIDIDDVTLKQGFVERMLNVGTILLISSDQTNPKLPLPGIGDVQHVFDLIDDTRRKERRRRGLHIETI